MPRGCKILVRWLSSWRRIVSLSNLELNELKTEILKIEEVKDLHAIKGWSLDDTNFYLRFHVRMDGDTKLIDVDKVKQRIKDILLKHKVTSSTIEFESQCSESNQDKN